MTLPDRPAPATPPEEQLVCDTPRCADPRGYLEVRRGDPCSTGRGTVVHDQADADAVARQKGWTIRRAKVACATCTTTGATA